MKKVLIVDDDVDLAALIKTKLEASGLEAVTLDRGDTAFDTAKAESPDVVVLDIMLPGQTGYQVCRRIRRDPLLYRVPVLILTALGEEPEILHGLEQGADDYLVKPFQFEKLLDKIRALLAMYEGLLVMNPLTGLIGTEAVKREMSHRLARDETFAACYVDVLNVRPYLKVHGQERQDNVILAASDTLKETVEELELFEVTISHMGGVHFVVLLRLDDYKAFCERAIEKLAEKTASLYRQVEREQGYIMAPGKSGRETRYGLMCFSIGVAHNQFRRFKNAQKMFEVLAQVKQKAEESGTAAVFVDRRRTER